MVKEGWVTPAIDGVRRGAGVGWCGLRFRHTSENKVKNKNLILHFSCYEYYNIGIPWDYNGIISVIAPVWLGGKVVMRVTAIFILPSEAVGDPITAQLHQNAATWRGARKLTRGTTAWTGGCRRSLHTCTDQTQQEHFLMLWVTDKSYEADENGEINVSLLLVKKSWAKHDKSWLNLGLFTPLYKNQKYFKISRTVFENVFIVTLTLIISPWPVWETQSIHVTLHL